VEAETAIIYNFFWVPMGIYLSARAPRPKPSQCN